jgi:hypothetical protein
MISNAHEGSEQFSEGQTLEVELEDAKRSFALKEWNKAADLYGEVLESM